MGIARRVHLGLLAVAIALGVAAPRPASAADRQIVDPAGDHPAPFMDLVGVSLALVQSKGAPALDVTFFLSGAVSPESRTAMTGYSFTAKVGGCALLVRFVGYPDRAFAASGFATTRCGAGRSAGGSYRIKDDTVTVTAPIRGLKGVAPGRVMSNLRAYTSPGEGMYHDDTTAPSALGDAASSSANWTIR